MAITASSNGVRSRQDPPLSMIERMTLIIDAFGGRESRLTLEEVTCRTGLPRSTVHRILEQLIRWEWVEHVSFGYCLGRRALGVSGGGEHMDVRAAAAPILHELAVQTGMVAHLTVLDGTDSVYLDKAGGRLVTSVPSRVGGRIPAHCTAGGKSMLAWLDPARVEEMYDRRMPRCADRSIVDVATLRHELNRIRRRHGVAFELEESARGFGCVGASVRCDDTPVAAISLCGEVPQAQFERLAPQVANAADTVSSTLYPIAGQTRRGRKKVASVSEAWSSDAMERLFSIQRGRWV